MIETEAIKVYTAQRDKLYSEPFGGLGKNLDIIHISMLYWPEEGISLRPLRGQPLRVMEQEASPILRVEGRPHGEYLERGGIRVTGI